MELAGTLYVKGLFSTGTAAAFVGISRREFIETMGQYGFPLISDASIDSLAEEVANASRYLRH